MITRLLTNPSYVNLLDGSSRGPGPVYIFCGDENVGGGGAIGDVDQYNSVDSWASKTTVTPGRALCGAATLALKGYIFCGFTNTDNIKDTDQYFEDTWTAKTDALVTRYSFAAVAIDGKAYCLFGDGDRSGVDRYTQGDNWSSLADYPDGGFVNQHAATGRAGTIYICGGGWAQSFRVTTFSFHPSTQFYVFLADMPAPARGTHKFMTLNSKMYATYGLLTGSSAAIVDIDQYHVANYWTVKTDGPAPRKFEHAVAGMNNKGYIMAGDGAGNVLIQDTDEYNSGGDSWIVKSDCPAPARYRAPGVTINE